MLRRILSLLLLINVSDSCCAWSLPPSSPQRRMDGNVSSRTRNSGAITGAQRRPPNSARTSSRWVMSVSSTSTAASTIAFENEIKVHKQQQDESLDQCTDRLRAALCKPSKTLAVALEVVAPVLAQDDDDDDYNDDDVAAASLRWSSTDLEARSMQARKMGVAALFTSCAVVAAQLVCEQQSSVNSFPGPIPVVYDLRDISPGISTTRWRDAVKAGVASVVVPMNDDNNDVWKEIQQFVPVVHRVESVDQATKLVKEWDELYGIVDSGDNASSRPMFVLIPIHPSEGGANEKDSVEDDIDPCVARFLSIRNGLPSHAVVLAEVQAMQPNNHEIHAVRGVTTNAAKASPSSTINAVLVRGALTGDNEDVAYSEFVLSSYTAKRSKTFNVSGLTGSTNGHFGGVATSVAKTWLRTQRQQQQQQQ